jgi:hypothetical protein
MKRSGNSALTVRVMFPAGDETMGQFFRFLLNENWKCILSFHVVLIHQGWRLGHGTLDINQGIVLVNILR